MVNRLPTLEQLICEEPALPDRQTSLDRDIDFLIRFEQLGQDFAHVCQALGIPYSPLPIRNRSRSNHYATYYDDELKEIVRQKFIDEITYGHYEFDRASSRG